MGLTRLAIQRPLTVLMVILMVMVMGVRAYTMLQVDRFPKVDFPYVSVVTVFPGAAPQDVEDLVTKPIEDAVAGISGIDTLTSQSNDGVSVVIVAFNQGVDGDKAAINVERQIATVRGKLPTDALDPSIVKADINSTPILQLVLSGPQGQDELAQLATDVLKPRLEAVPGVAAVNVTGGRPRQVQVNVDPHRLAAFGISLASVQQTLAANNLNLPAGALDEGRQRNAVRAVGQFSSLSDLENLVISGGSSSSSGGSSTPALPGQNAGGMVYLKDVATIQQAYPEASRILRFNGTDTVSLSVVKTGDSNTIQVVDDARTALNSLTRDLPAGARLTIVTDNSTFTRASVAGVQEDLVLAILITALVMLLFLHTIRSSFIVLLAIPTSLIATFLVMWVLGFSLNTLTLMALTLVIGIVVDDSIVVIENTERHLKMGEPPKKAAIEGRSEIGLAAIAITLVDVVVYTPVAFTSGIIGQFFKSYGLTIVAATLASWLVAFTLTPMLSALWLKSEGEAEGEPQGLRKVFSILFRPVSWLWNGFTRAWEAGFGALTNLYGATIRFALRNVFTEALVVLIAVAALAAGVYLVAGGYVGAEFIPQEDDGQFTVGIEMPAGTNLAATDAAARQAELIIRTQVPEVASMLTDIGGGGNFLASTTSANNASISVQVVDKKQRQRNIVQITNALRPYLAAVPEARTSIALSSAFGSGGGGPTGALTMQLSGPDIDELTRLAAQVEQVVKSVPGTADIGNTGAVQSSETRFVIDRRRASDLNLSVAQVASTLRTALSGTEVGKYKQTGETDIPIVLRLDADARGDLGQLLQVPVSFPSGGRLTLGQVVNQEDSHSPARISRSNRQRIMTITANAAGRSSGDVINAITAAVGSQVQFPEGYGFKFTGSAQQQQESFTQLGSALLISILLIYMLLVALYQSWLAPLSIMFSLPVATVGAFGGLWLTGRTINIISLLGLILLTGIVTKNAILIVDFATRLREAGMSRKEALIQAGKLRLRPILMTTAVLVFALLPLLFNTGAGSETRAPLAAVVIGGNITSTVLSLILVPVAYNALDALGGGFSSLLRRLFGTKRQVGLEPATPAADSSVAGGE